MPLIFGCPRSNRKIVDDSRALSADTVSENDEGLYGGGTLIPIDSGRKYDIWASRDERYHIAVDSLCAAEDSVFANKTRLRGDWEVVLDRSIAGEGFDPWYVAERFDIYDSITSLVLVSDGRDSGQSGGFLANYDTEGRCIDALEIFYEDYVEYYSELGSAFYFDCQSWETPRVELFDRNTESFTRQVVDVLRSGRFSGREIPADSIRWVEKMCFIIPSPEIMNFYDEESPEAQDWFAVMDDWVWYSAQTRVALKEIGLKEVDVEKRYLGFRISEGDQSKVILDSRSPDFSALVFKARSMPVFIDICMPEIPEIKKYLNIR